MEISEVWVFIYILRSLIRSLYYFMFDLLINQPKLLDWLEWIEMKWNMIFKPCKKIRLLWEDSM